MPMKTIGNLATAKMLNDWFVGPEDMFEESRWNRRAPKGFNVIGEGCSRKAILDKANNLVYKIGDFDSNLNESFNARRLRKRSTRSLGFELVIPHSRTYSLPGGPARGTRPNVAVQEYAQDARNTYCRSQDSWATKEYPCNCKNKTPICWREVHRRISDFADLIDIHCSNVLMDKSGRYWLIDLAD